MSPEKGLIFLLHQFSGDNCIGFQRVIIHLHGTRILKWNLIPKTEARSGTHHAAISTLKNMQQSKWEKITNIYIYNIQIFKLPPPHMICQWLASSIRKPFVFGRVKSQPGPMTKTFVSARWSAALSCGMLLNWQQAARTEIKILNPKSWRWMVQMIFLESFCVICLGSKILVFRGGVCFMILKLFGICRAVPPSQYIYSNSDPQDDQLHLYCVGFQPEPSRKQKHDRERLDPTLPEFFWPLFWSVYGLIDTIYPFDFGGFWVFFGIS